MKILYIIPARGGSKGLPGKNIRLLNGKPLIAYSIEAAQNSKYKGQFPGQGSLELTEANVLVFEGYLKK